MEEGVRRAVAADADDLARLAELARRDVAAERDGPAYLLTEAPTGLAAEPGEGRATWVATLDGVAVGFASGSLRELEGGHLLAVLESIFVEPEARQVSLGEFLVGAAVAWAEAAGAIGIDAHALPGARATKNFFEANRFTTRVLTVHRPLDAHPGRGRRPI